MPCQWSFPDSVPTDWADAALCMGVSPLLAQCLANRGIRGVEAVESFLHPKLKHLADPFLLPNMDAAVTRLLLARQQREPLVVFGDYDVDGVTSTALLFEVLTQLGWNVNYFLPHRRDEGYGLTVDGLRNCLEKHPVKLILAVDCGSSATVAIDSLHQQGVEVVVLDHHQISDPPPRAVALVNPRAGVAPFQEYCSAGLGFKLAHALIKRLRDANDPAGLKMDIRLHLDLVALGTIADLVPLTGENRIFVSAGLERLNETARPGLAALKTVAQCAGRMGSHEVGFQLTPRLNAAGRLENAEDALRLLLAADQSAAEPIARSLDAQNRERQTIERQIVQEIVASIKGQFNPENDYVIVEGNDQWHVGVVGIVASRLLAEFHRPVIVLGGSGGHWRGSGRSIEGFDLAAALRECSDILLRSGGHAMAAGLSIEPSKLGDLRQRLNALAKSALKPERLQRSLKLDAAVALGDLTLDTIAELEKLNPTGQGNPPVRLAALNVTLQQPAQRMGKEGQHARLRVTDGQKTAEAVWWNCAGAALPEGRFDIAFTPQINEYNGRRSPQLRLLDWRECVA
jgi:single-stranded-DNA-specific exonuclease